MLVHSSSVLIPILELLRLVSASTTSLSVLIVHSRILLIWLSWLSKRTHHIIGGLHQLLLSASAVHRILLLSVIVHSIIG